MKDNTPPAAEIEVIVPSSLTHEFRLFVLLDHLEKLSIRRAELHAADTPRASTLAKRPITTLVRIIKYANE